MIKEWQGITPEISEDAFVAETAIIIGKVKIESKASIWFGAVLRGDIEDIVIKEGANIQDNCVIHTSPNLPVVVGENTTVGHLAMLHGCKIGKNCLIGMSAVILDGAVVPDNTIVAAGAVVPPGKKLESGIIWAGNPAKPLREIRPEEIEMIKKNAAHYIELANSYN